jgi:hypothetical protein
MDEKRVMGKKGFQKNLQLENLCRLLILPRGTTHTIAYRSVQEKLSITIRQIRKQRQGRRRQGTNVRKIWVFWMPNVHKP